MHFDTGLNVVWVVLGVCAFAATIRSTWCKPATNRTPAWLHIVGVALIVAALFPYISATDDVLRIEHLTEKRTSQHSSKAPPDNLIRLYEAMDAPIAVTPSQVILTLFFVLLLTCFSQVGIDRVGPFTSGRSPPPLCA